MAPKAAPGPAPDQLRAQRRGGRSPRSSPTAVPDLADWLPQIEAAADGLRPAQASPPTAWTTTTCSSSGRGCSTSSPTQLAQQAADVPPHPDRRDAGHQRASRSSSSRRSPRPGAGNLTAVGDDAQSIYRFRGANYDNILKFPERHPGAGSSGSRSTTARRPRSSRSPTPRSRTTRSGFPKTLVSARPDGLPPGGRRRRPTPTRRPTFVCQQILEAHEQGRPAGPDGRPLPQPLRQHRAPGRAASRGASPTRSGAACGSSSRPTSRTCWPTCGSWSTRATRPAWRRLLLLLPGIGPAKAAAIYQRARRRRPTRSRRWRRPRRWRSSRPRARGFFAGVRRRPPEDPGDRPRAPTRPRRSARSSRGAIPRRVRHKYERPDNRIADIEQLAVLAARYDSLERLIAELLLAGDVYGMDTRRRPSEPAGRARPEHDPPGQGAGVVARLRPPADRGRASRTAGPSTSPAARTRNGGSSTSPSPGRWTSSTLTYPSTITRGGCGPTVFTTPSRFLTEIDADLYERAQLEHDYGSLDDDDDEGGWDGFGGRGSRGGRSRW